jgi:integrase/recombinase XerD
MEKTSHHILTGNTPVVIQELREQYLQAQGASPNTATLRRKAIAHLGRFLSSQGRSRLADITPADLEGWRADLRQRRLAPTSLEVYCRSVRQFFTWLEQEQRLFVNPAAGFLVPRPRRPRLPVLSPAQLQLLLSQMNPASLIGMRDRALLATLYATGVTAGELLSLQMQDASPEAIRVRGRKPRTLPLDVTAADAVTRYLNEARPGLLGGKQRTFLWLTQEGEPLTQGALHQVVRRHAKAAGLGCVSSASLRRACGVHRWQAGAHLLELQLLLGHASLKTLCQYLRVTTAELFTPHKETHHESAALAR